ncbi:hypothetical protein KC363_g1234 [Hortaea werneckii]|nr:hypothetical protein KC361_g7897 [Hortaea werneckii]KAI6881457.1 hypothetical protein KC325_g6508 [Hortaea werneckii]KAI6989561.1 hypothetical protein KC359_g7152 [Hortaea werneckii]KAI7143093.1 hypothetical protein KC344_g6616 [Hortaea werneckii]KAI7170858.1 hypothetical protein KC360_g6504 [Hortaea werneckii]
MAGTRSSRRGEDPPRKPFTLRLRKVQFNSQTMDADEAFQQVPAVVEGDRQPDQKPKSGVTATTAADGAGASQPATMRPKLKLKNTRRPSAQSIDNATSASSADSDTIAVQQKPEAVTAAAKNQAANQPAVNQNDSDSPLSDLEELGRRADAGHVPSPSNSPNSRANRPWGRKGKAPAFSETEESHKMPEANDDQVEELEIDPDEDQGFEDTDYSGKEDDRDVISIHSDNDGQEEGPRSSGLLDRPWKAMGFDRSMRQRWEIMYYNAESRPLNGSWDLTEDYQREKDIEMQRYIKDFRAKDWVLGREAAEEAISRMHQRCRLRELGVPIYGQPSIHEMVPNSTPFVRTMPGPSGDPRQQMHMSSQPQYPQRHPSMPGPDGSRPQSGPQRHGPFEPPTPHGIPNHMHPPLPQQVLRSQPNARPINVPPGPHPEQQMAHGPPSGMPPPGLHPGHVGMPPMSHMPHGLPYAVPPHMMSHANLPMHAPHPLHGPPHGMPQPPPGAHQAPVPQPSGSTAPKKQSRPKKETPQPEPPPPPPPTPPYPLRERPMPRKEFNKTGKKNMRKQAEALEFPWHRKMDFYKARADAKWDDSQYDKVVLDNMAAVRERNLPIITRLDEELAEKQRNQRNKRKKGQAANDPDGSDDGKKPEGEEQKTARKNANIGGDPYYSGNYSFATEGDRQKALALQRKTPDEIIEAAEERKIDWDLCKEIYICWNPGKKGLTQDLVQAKFRIFDTLITRKQLQDVPILSRRAAECIVDFCPDLLWRETLLRIVSEAGYGNKDVRDRFCYNGCHNDKATVTKRIAAALGQKQMAGARTKMRDESAKKTEDDVVMAGTSETEAAPINTKGESAGESSTQGAKKGKRGQAAGSSKDRYHPGEEEWHEANKADFANYIRFFGKRPGTRVWHAGEKRKMMSDAENAAAGNESGPIVGGGAPSSPMSPDGRADREAGITKTNEHTDEEPNDSGDDDDDDAVSEQPDDIFSDDDEERGDT